MACSMVARPSLDGREVLLPKSFNTQTSSGLPRI
jgi:hypothetical protein